MISIRFKDDFFKEQRKLQNATVIIASRNDYPSVQAFFDGAVEYMANLDKTAPIKSIYKAVYLQEDLDPERMDGITNQETAYWQCLGKLSSVYVDIQNVEAVYNIELHPDRFDLLKKIEHIKFDYRYEYIIVTEQDFIMLSYLSTSK